LLEEGGGGGVLVERFRGWGESVKADLRWEEEEEEGRAGTPPLGGSSGRPAPGGGRGAAWPEEEVGWAGATGTGRWREGGRWGLLLLHPSSGMWCWGDGAHISKVWDLLLELLLLLL
jgi:hypothetical protein